MCVSNHQNTKTPTTKTPRHQEQPPRGLKTPKVFFRVCHSWCLGGEKVRIEPCISGTPERWEARGAEWNGKTQTPKCREAHGAEWNDKTQTSKCREAHSTAWNGKTPRTPRTATKRAQNAKGILSWCAFLGVLVLRRTLIDEMTSCNPLFGVRNFTNDGSLQVFRPGDWVQPGWPPGWRGPEAGPITSAQKNSHAPGA